MTRLIDADALSKKWQDVLDIKTGEEETVAYKTFEMFIQRLSQEPTIDPVHAAGACYCWECRNYNKPRLGWCSHHMDRENPDDFCSWGQRREDLHGKIYIL